MIPGAWQVLLKTRLELRDVPTFQEWLAGRRRQRSSVDFACGPVEGAVL